MGLAGFGKHTGTSFIECQCIRTSGKAQNPHGPQPSAIAIDGPPLPQGIPRNDMITNPYHLTGDVRCHYFVKSMPIT
jgi:hypothetical protein